MEEKCTCKKCKKQYDCKRDFIEDTELLEALNYFIDIEGYCSSCLYKFRDQIDEAAIHFING